MDLLEVRNLNKHYKQFDLKNISFSIPAGYIMGYVGQNGAGKTTTISIITGVIHEDSGTITIDGRTIKEDSIRYKDSIGYIADDCFFSANFTIADICNTFADFYPSFSKQKFMNYINQWNLPQKKQIKEFSRGMKLKTMFAEVFSRDTKVLMLDEATNGLDPVAKDEILSLMQEYIADGDRSILFSTHILSDLEQIADYIFFIDQGEKILADTKDELTDSYLLVRADEKQLSEEQKQKIIGIRKSSVMMEGIIHTEDATCFHEGSVIEKPTIDQIVVHYILERKKKYRIGEIK